MIIIGQVKTLSFNIEEIMFLWNKTYKLVLLVASIVSPD